MQLPTLRQLYRGDAPSRHRSGSIVLAFERSPARSTPARWLKCEAGAGDRSPSNGSAPATARPSSMSITFWLRLPVSNASNSDLSLDESIERYFGIRIRRSGALRSAQVWRMPRRLNIFRSPRTRQFSVFRVPQTRRMPALCSGRPFRPTPISMTFRSASLSVSSECPSGYAARFRLPSPKRWWLLER